MPVTSLSNMVCPCRMKCRRLAPGKPKAPCGCDDDRQGEAMVQAGRRQMVHHGTFGSDLVEPRESTGQVPPACRTAFEMCRRG